MSTRVAFDVTAQIAGATGIARYQRELTAALERDGVVVDRIAFGRASQPIPERTRHVGVPSRFVYPSWRWLGIPPVRALAPRADLLHAGAPVIPRTRLPVVATVHDLDAIDYPDLHPDRSRLQLESVLATLDRAAAIITGSEHAATRLRQLGIAADRLTVVHHGVTPPAAPIRPQLASPFLLAVGLVMPRKGFDVLLEAFAQVADGPLAGHLLVIAGPPGERSDELERRRGELGLNDRVVLTGRVGDGELAGFYAAATAVCVPSRAEGFGLAVVEAGAAGSPLVCSDLPVLREVSGGHAMFAEAGNPAAWARALTDLVADPDGAARRVEAASRWAAAFTWERAARETRAVYEAVLARNGARRRSL